MSSTGDPGRDRLAAARVIAVIRAPSAEGAVLTADAVIEGGLGAVEISYSTPDATAAIEEIGRRHGGDVLLGAGTVRRADQVAPAIAAGATFIVSPGLDQMVVAATREAGALPVPGVLTPTEVMRACSHGATTQKLFPAGPGGPSLLRSLRDPFPDVGFIPTGGVSADDVGDWLRAGAIAVGAAGSLCPRDEIEAARFDLIRERAARFVAAAVGDS